MRILAAGVLAAMLVPPAADAQTQQQYPPQAILKAWDKDGDGVLTKTEWIAAGRKAQGFDFVDADGDGQVTLEELRSAMGRQAGS